MELLRALGVLIEPPATEHRRVAGALGLPPVPDASAYYATVQSQRFPYASVYLGAEGMMGGVARDRVAGFWRALGRDGQEERGRAPDHLASLLALLAALGEGAEAGGAAGPGGEAEARCVLLGQAREALMWEHLSPWLGVYLATFRGSSEAYYRAWASILTDAVESIEARMRIPTHLPVVLRQAPVIVDPREQGGAKFIASLLAPVRTGMVVLREDLVRLSDETGMACRAGERRYLLESFFAQNPQATLEWLADHAGRWRDVVRGPSVIVRWWRRRSLATRGLLRALANEAGSMPTPRSSAGQGSR